MLSHEESRSHNFAHLGAEDIPPYAFMIYHSTYARNVYTSYSFYISADQDTAVSSGISLGSTNSRWTSDNCQAPASQQYMKVDENAGLDR